MTESATAASPSRWRRWLRALGYLVREGLAGVVSMALSVLLVVWLMFLVVGPGWLIAPYAVRVLRWWAGAGRRRAGRYRGTVIPERYPPVVEMTSISALRRLELTPQVLRDGLWTILHALIAPVVGILAIGLPAGAVNVIAIPAYWWAMPVDQPVDNIYKVTSWWGAVGMVPIGIGYAVGSLLLTPLTARGISGLARLLLSPARRSELAKRVDVLTESRAAAFDTHAAELRRIERDLHDGAQNRLVGVVMMLGLAERSARSNPDQVLPQLLKAQDAAAEALAGLRTIVHDIYPPILDELGLEGAVSALAGRCAIPCVVESVGLRRAPAAVESAAYFIVAEGITNAVKHSGAQQITVTLTTVEIDRTDTVRLIITDDGSGGAQVRDDGGIAGISRRAAAFEGTVDLTSPKGGPTALTVELPCGL